MLLLFLLLSTERLGKLPKVTQLSFSPMQPGLAMQLLFCSVLPHGSSCLHFKGETFGALMACRYLAQGPSMFGKQDQDCI